MNSEDSDEEEDNSVYCNSDMTAEIPTIPLSELPFVSDYTVSTELSDHTDAILALSVLPDGRRFASGGYDSILRIWSLDDYKAFNFPLRFTQCYL